MRRLDAGSSRRRQERKREMKLKGSLFCADVCSRVYRLHVSQPEPESMSVEETGAGVSFG